MRDDDHGLISRVLVMVAGYPPAYLGGGPIRTIEAMVEMRASLEPVRVLTSAHDLGVQQPMDVPRDRWVERGRARVRYSDLTSWRGRWAMLRQVRTATEPVLYLNSLWNPWFSLLPLLVRRAGLTRFTTVVLAPRGELELSALGLKARKKRLALRLSRWIGLHREVLFHASTEAEAVGIRRVFPTASVLVKEDEKLLVPREAADPAPRQGPLRLVYLGRISPVKRVDVLIRALAQVPSDTEVELTVYGGGEPDYLQHCRTVAAEASVRVRFAGPVAHEQVAAVFDEADYACFATAGENFAHVVPEALAQGCPVLIGDVTPWTSVIAAGGGIVVSDAGSPQEWAQVFRALAAEDPAARVDRRMAALAAVGRWLDAREGETFLDVLAAGATTQAGDGS